MNLRSVPTGKCLRIFGEPVIHAVYIETLNGKKDSENFVWDSHCLIYARKMRLFAAQLLTRFRDESGHDFVKVIEAKRRGFIRSRCRFHDRNGWHPDEKACLYP